MCSHSSDKPLSFQEIVCQKKEQYRDGNAYPQVANSESQSASAPPEALIDLLRSLFERMSRREEHVDSIDEPFGASETQGERPVPCGFDAAYEQDIQVVEGAFLEDDDEERRDDGTEEDRQERDVGEPYEGVGEVVEQDEDQPPLERNTPDDKEYGADGEDPGIKGDRHGNGRDGAGQKPRFGWARLGEDHLDRPVAEMLGNEQEAECRDDDRGEAAQLGRDG